MAVRLDAPLVRGNKLIVSLFAQTGGDKEKVKEFLLENNAQAKQEQGVCCFSLCDAHTCNILLYLTFICLYSP